MIEILPAILPENFDELTGKLGGVSRAARMVHIDVCDGEFVPSVSWPYNPADAMRFSAIAREEKGLPYWQDLDFEVHLMIEQPENQLDKWVHVGVSRIVVHAEAAKDFGALVDRYGTLVELGLALKFETTFETLPDTASQAAFLQLMSIARIGYQGSKFEASIVKKISAARAQFPGVPIAVDGGVNLENAASLIQAGATRLVVGSAIFRSDDPAGAYRKFAALAKGV